MKAKDANIGERTTAFIVANAMKLKAKTIMNLKFSKLEQR